MQTMSNKYNQKRNQNKKEDRMSNEFTLSSGVKVTFSRMPQNMSQEVFTRLLKEVKLDKKGQISESADPQDNLKLLNKMNSYYSTLVAFGAELVGEPKDYYEVVDPKWLKKLHRADYDLSDYDLEDSDDVNFLFLRYFGFVTAEDWQVLTENVLNLPS